MTKTEGSAAMMNAALLLVLLALALVTVKKHVIISRREPESVEARYLLGWNASVVGATIAGGVGLLIVDAPAWSDAIPTWVRLVQHAVFSVTVISTVYNTVGLAVVIIGLDRHKIRRCALMLGAGFIIKTILELLYRVARYPLPWYGLTLFGICFVYNVRVILWFGVHAKDATPITKWRMICAKWGMTIGLLAPLDWWLLQPITVSWVIRPSIVMAMVGWMVFALPSMFPEGFGEFAILREVGRKLLKQNTLLLTILADFIQTRAQEVEPWLRQFAGAASFSEVQTELLVRAAYLKTLMSEREQIRHHFAVDLLSVEDVFPIIRDSTEWWNGTGFPRGVAGESIPLESRVLALLFAFNDALSQTSSVSTLTVFCPLLKAS